MSNANPPFEGSIPPPPRPIEYQDVDPRGWWISALIGVALVIVGVWLLTNLYDSVTVLAVLVGISLLIGGMTEIMALGGHPGLGWAAWVGGGIVIAAGIVVLAWPHATLKVVAVVAGAALLLAGALRIVTALMEDRAQPDRTAQLTVGAVGVVLGAVILAWPDATLLVLGFILGFKAVVTGLIAIGTAWQAHRLAA